MYKRYFRWKDATCSADSVEWIEMTGKEFYRFVTDPKNANRQFTDMGDIMMECTPAQYKEFKAEDDHSAYILAQEIGWVTQSLETLAKEGGFSSDELVEDMSQDVEDEAIARIDANAIRFALKHLDSKSYRLIYALYLANKRISERDLAKNAGISQNAIHKQKKRILKTLKFWVVRFQKNPQ